MYVGSCTYTMHRSCADSEKDSNVLVITSRPREPGIAARPYLSQGPTREHCGLKFHARRRWMRINSGWEQGKVAANRCMESSAARIVHLERAHFRKP